MDRRLVPTSAGRSRNLAAVRRTNTKPEVAVRSALHRRGYRFRKDLRLDLPGGRARPDVVFTRAKVAVFIDGCFWHVCPIHGREPTSNEWYWTPKLRKNVARDQKTNDLLTSSGWIVVRIWEHEALPEAIEAVEIALKKGA
ncbi:very short patch repair endonuclease [Kineosporia mesophila]|uniref:very short patch repair endonuclease n=1 Tax=Kineosporia mesophila TaxID=566012 RepID=UPI001E287EED|nr:very short patch repair endonuclease [Kineosporia mesophila]